MQESSVRKLSSMGACFCFSGLVSVSLPTRLIIISIISIIIIVVFFSFFFLFFFVFMPESVKIQQQKTNQITHHSRLLSFVLSLRVPFSLFSIYSQNYNHYRNINPRKQEKSYSMKVVEKHKRMQQFIATTNTNAAIESSSVHFKRLKEEEEQPQQQYRLGHTREKIRRTLYYPALRWNGMGLN